MHTHTLMHMFAHMYAHSHACTPMHTHAHACTDARTCMHHTHMRTPTCTQFFRPYEALKSIGQTPYGGLRRCPEPPVQFAKFCWMALSCNRKEFSVLGTGEAKFYSVYIHVY